MYEVHLSQKAEKYLKKLDNNINERLKKKLKKLGKRPVPSESKIWVEEIKEIKYLDIG